MDVRRCNKSWLTIAGDLAYTKKTQKVSLVKCHEQSHETLTITEVWKTER